MAIIFLPAQKRDRYLFGALLACLVLGSVLIWYGYVRKVSFQLFTIGTETREQVEINFEIFQDPAFLELGEARPPILLPGPDEVGKRNPFEK